MPAYVTQDLHSAFQLERSTGLICILTVGNCMFPDQRDPQRGEFAGRDVTTDRRALYFVGAGFSRALKKGRNVPPLLFDFIRLMADEIDDDVIAVALAGMYRDKLLTVAIPAISEETVDALADGPTEKRTAARRTEFANGIRSVAQPDVESLLAMALAKSTFTHQRFRFAIARLFQRMSWDLRLGCLRRLIRARAKLESMRHTVVSFNYDLILEHLLEEELGWVGASGYGVPMPFGVQVTEFDHYAATVRAVVSGAAPRLDAVALAAPAEGPPWMVLKPHGSLNWLRRSALGGENERVLLVDASSRVAYPLEDSFMNVWIPGRPPGGFNIQIIAPEAGKVGLTDILALEKDALEKADEVWVLGWSVPITDLDQRSLIQQAVKNRTRPIDHLVVVNLKEPDSYFENVAHLFGVSPSAVERYNRGFLCFCRLCLLKQLAGVA